MNAPRACVVTLVTVAPVGCTLVAPLGGLVGGAPPEGGSSGLSDVVAAGGDVDDALSGDGSADVTDLDHGSDAADALEADVRSNDGTDSSPLVSIKLVQHVSLSYAAAATMTQQLPAAVAAGDFLAAVMLTHNDTDAGVSYGISDSLTQTWRTTTYRQCDNGNGGAQIWYAESAHPGVDTITVTQTAVTAAGGELGLGVFEYRGLASSSTLDVESSQCAPITTATMSSPGIMTTTQDLLVGVFVDPCGQGTMSAATPFSMEDGNTSYFYLYEDDQNAGTGVANGFYQATATDARTSNCWMAAIAAFKAQ
jgi:hypothetical protein